MEYSDFINDKSQIDTQDGFKPVFMPDYLKPFQSYEVDWAVRKGRAAIFNDCGMGKSIISMAWAQNVIEKTNKPVLLLTPLAVSGQFVKEGEKFGIDIKRGHDGIVTGEPRIIVTNYEQLSKFDPRDFSGVVLDESSILKNFQGTRRKEITNFMRKMRYRLLASATPSPNDFVELGTSSEALGYLGHMDMLNKFFKNDLNNSAVGRYAGSAIKWRFKGHAEEFFWRFVTSWARAARKPSDLGDFSDAEFKLPPLIENEHIVSHAKIAEGMLFQLPAVGLDEQREEVRNTVKERCEKVAELVSHGKPAIVWCNLDEEADLCEKLISGAKQVSGKQKDEVKESRLLGFADGDFRVLVTKPKIGAWGLNYQHCAHQTVFPTHSYEQYHQSTRRSWRFGQKQEVVIDMVTTEGGKGVMKNLQRKAAQADSMFESIVRHMADSLAVNRGTKATKKTIMPSWL
jgi:uncharacterized protein YaaQ